MTTMRRDEMYTVNSRSLDSRLIDVSESEMKCESEPVKLTSRNPYFGGDNPVKTVTKPLADRNSNRIPCFGESSIKFSKTRTANGNQPQVVKVFANKIRPQNLRITVGDTVEWVVYYKTDKTVLLEIKDVGGKKSVAESIDRHLNFQHAFEFPGSFEYSCVSQSVLKAVVHAVPKEEMENKRLSSSYERKSARNRRNGKAKERYNRAQVSERIWKNGNQSFYSPENLYGKNMPNGLDKDKRDRNSTEGNESSIFASSRRSPQHYSRSRSNSSSRNQVFHRRSAIAYLNAKWESAAAKQQKA